MSRRTAGARHASLHQVDAALATPGARVYVQPTGILRGPDAVETARQERALPLAGGPLAFGAARVWVRHDGGLTGTLLTAPELAVWAARRDATAALLARLTAPRTAFPGVPDAGPAIMGIVNVTPDSFSDGGQFADTRAAIAHGDALAEAGAHIIDVGGESTRPGAAPVPVDEELRRVIPVVTALAVAGLTVSVDTRRAAVMRAALDAGAAIVNDVTALTGDPASLTTVAAAAAPVILMHMRGEPRTMQDDPQYADAALDIYDALEARVGACRAAGIAPPRIAVDPGIGFGKSVDHNLELLAALGLFHGLGCPVVLGASRKSFIGRVDASAVAGRRLAGSLTAALAGLDQGVQIVRVHDVAETAQAVRLWRGISSA